MIRKYFIFLLILPLTFFCKAQKKSLDHSVYDSWQSIGERIISNNGKYVVYTVVAQEGDNTLVILATDNSYKKLFPRGYAASITADSRFAIFKIHPLFKETRDARIKKKKPDEMPKDSFAIVTIGTDEVKKFSRVKDYKIPEKGSGWVAFQYDKTLPETNKSMKQPDSASQVNNLIKTVDSLTKVTDSLRSRLNEIRSRGWASMQTQMKLEKRTAKPDDQIEEGTDLILQNLNTGEIKKIKLVLDYLFSENGKALIVKTSRSKQDSVSQELILWINTSTGKIDTVMKRFNDAKSISLDTAATQLAFVAERDSSLKSLKKFYKLWYFTPGMDSAVLKVDRTTEGMPNNWTVSEFANIEFSKDSKKFFFSIYPVRPVKDTTLVDFETARLDIWHYNDDYLQPQQLKQLDEELKRGYTAVMHKGEPKIIRLGTEDAENIAFINEGNADQVLARSTKGNRISNQWLGFTPQSAYIISLKDGSRKLIEKNVRAFFTPSPAGRYVIWYDWKKRQWFCYNINEDKAREIAKDIKVPLWDEEEDIPDDPDPYGLMGWSENDKYVYLYDRYDIWKCDPEGIQKPVSFTRDNGRINKHVYRYINLDKEERFIKENQVLYFSLFDEKTKKSGLALFDPVSSKINTPAFVSNFYRNFQKAKNSQEIIFTKESFDASPDLYTGKVNTSAIPAFTEIKLSSINQQQKDFNWFTVDLIKWKMFDGRMSEGLLYKPENFDSSKKYPVIFYFYERNADTRYHYIAPEPVRASINIPYFVSNGYLVFDPNIYYKKGHPGESAYNSVISAVRYLSKFKWVDSTKLGIQGHSWGGYQVAYLITRTNIFAAAEAGAPVVNMTSAYGGIRWGSGLNRQFQYERTQSRIGATLWEKPELYVSNSALFHADRIKTPVLILHNDQDDAVPWYQGIEFFTALRRLSKKAWLVSYNGELHGLQDRRNRKDWSIRLQQYFDHFLKGTPAPKWLREGVPATLKGIELGLEN